MDGNPWIRIPAADYEAHMRAAGQSAVLRELFARLYTELRPACVAVLGCTTGSDLELVDAAITERAVGVDVNADYLETAKDRLAGALGSRLLLVHGDVLRVELSPMRFDLVHAALLLEYVDPVPLFARVVRWLTEGGTCSVVTQEQRDGVPAVSDTGYTSLRPLAQHMVLRDIAEVVAAANSVGLQLISKRAVDLPGGKTLVNSLFQRVAAMSQFPDDENGAVLRDMAKQGIDLVSPRMMDFEHCFPDEAAARGFLAAVVGTVREAHLFPADPEEGTGWEVQCRERMVPTHTAIAETERRLADVAARFGGYPDGWGSLSNPDGSPA
jgi:ubiquinone/menaquinone biosynthesis C-methylase UbiE